MWQRQAQSSYSGQKASCGRKQILRKAREGHRGREEVSPETPEGRRCSRTMSLEEAGGIG